MKLIVETTKIPFRKVNREEKYPGVGKIPDKVRSVEGIEYKFFGQDPQQGPWIYMVKFPAGHRIEKHSHAADRVEYLTGSCFLASWSNSSSSHRIGAGASRMCHST